MNIKSNEVARKEALKNSFIRYLQNATNETETYYLINIIRNINWYWKKNMFDFFENMVVDEFDEDSLFIDYSKDDSSSSKGILSNLECSVVTSKRAIRIEEATKTVLDVEKLFIVDDFIGSGDTCLGIIKKLEEAGYSDKEIHIISYICHEKGKKRIEDYQGKNKVILHYNVLEKCYTHKIHDFELKKYIKSICSRCKNKNFAFGYKKCGAMVSINGTSSNNNLSMLYSDDIDNWNKLLDRDIDLWILNTKRKNIIQKDKFKITMFYKESKLEEVITLKEFEVLILLYNCCGMDIELLKKFGFFATLEECEETLKSLYEKNILKDDCFVEIIDKEMIKILKKFDKYIDDNFIKEKNRRFY